MELLHKLYADIMTAWAGWDVRYRIGAVAVVALVIYLLLSALHPLMRFLLLAIFVIAVAWLLFPAQVCSLPGFTKFCS